MAARSPGSRRGPADPYGLMPRTGLVGPAVAALVLVLVGAVTAALYAGWVPVSIGAKPAGSGGAGGGIQVNATPAPSNVVVTDPRANIPGSLVYVKDGNLWIQTGDQATQLTSSGGVPRSPSWSPDGQWIYYIQTTVQQGYFPEANGNPARYTMNVPTLSRISPDGKTNQALLSGRYRKGSYIWFYWLRRPGRVARRQDRRALLRWSRPDPERRRPPALQPGDQEADQAGPRREPAATAIRTQPGGPTASSSCTSATAATAQRGVPQIYAYNPATKKSVPLGAPGYMQPVVVTRRALHRGHPPDPRGRTDVAILDARTGAEVLPADERRRLVGPGLVAARRCDRVPAHRRPDRRPQDDRPDRQRPDLEGDRSYRM